MTERRPTALLPRLLRLCAAVVFIFCFEAAVESAAVAAAQNAPKRAANEPAVEAAAEKNGDAMPVLEPEKPRAEKKAPRTPRTVPAKNLRGWDHLYRQLIAKTDADPAVLAEIFADKRMPKREELFFSLVPRESKHLYRKHNTARARKNALEFYHRHRGRFAEGRKRYGVPEEIVLAILQIETQCGRFTGRQMVFFRLSRLASASEPDNVLANFRRYLKSGKSHSHAAVRLRAEWLEEQFLPHVAASIQVARRMGLHPLELKGSGSGAIGMPQFLPGNVDRFGVDADGDGRIDLYHPEDAILSVANFLARHGWLKDKPMSHSQKRKVIFEYNRSDEYVSTVMAMAGQLKAQLKPPPRGGNKEKQSK